MKQQRETCAERCNRLEALLQEFINDESLLIHVDDVGRRYCAYCYGDDGYDHRAQVIRAGYIHEPDCLYLRARAALGLDTLPPPIIRQVFPTTH